jgi:hypothetical protein
MSVAGPLAPQSNEMLEVDLELLVFVERYATDLLKWDLISFFAQNPYGRDTVLNIANRVGRNARVVYPHLEDLVLLQVVERHRLDGETVYQLTQDPSLRRAALRFGQQARGEAGILRTPSSEAGT